MAASKPKRPTRGSARGKYDRDKTKMDRREEQRTRLLDAAEEVIAAKGFANASVADIVQLAGMSRRTFYELFDDLDDCLLVVHDRATKVAFRFVEERVRAEAEPLRRITVGIEAFLTILSQQGDLARVLFREIRAAGPKTEALYEATISRFVGLVFEGVADAYARGFATRPPDELTVFALVSAAEAVGLRYVSRREEARALEAAPQLVELFVRAFR